MSLERARSLCQRSAAARLCCSSSCQERASWVLVPGSRQPLGLDSHFPTVPKTPFLLPHPSHDSVLRNVPGAKGRASQGMNAFPLCSCSFQRHRATFVLAHRGLNHLLPGSTHAAFSQASLPAGTQTAGLPGRGLCVPNSRGPKGAGRHS